MARITAVAAVAASLSLSAFAFGQVDPRGVFHNQFSGSFSGTEWFQVMPVAGQSGRYLLADIFGGGFAGTIDTQTGQVVLDGGIGGGSYSSSNAFVITPNLGGTVFTFNNMRAPQTTPDFPLQLVSAVPSPNQIVAGEYTSTTTQLNPRTGAVISGGQEQVTITVSGSSFRITDPQGLYFQGVFETPTQVGFRVVVPTPSDARFRTFPGSAINFSQNMLGYAAFAGRNQFEAIILLQSRTSLGSQTQLAFRFEAFRTNPLPNGDLNGAYVVSNVDRNLLLAQLGLREFDDEFNIAADILRDGIIDSTDVALFDGFFTPCPGDTNGDLLVNFADLNTVLSTFGFEGPGLAADLNDDGVVNFADLNEVLSSFGASCR